MRQSWHKWRAQLQPHSHRRDLPANSRSFLMVITQETTQPLATLHRLLTMRFHDPTEQQDVGLPLMIPLGMVMLDVSAQRPPQGALTKENDLRQTLVLYRLDPAFSIRIQVRTAGRQGERLDPPDSIIARKEMVYFVSRSCRR